MIAYSDEEHAEIVAHFERQDLVPTRIACILRYQTGNVFRVETEDGHFYVILGAGPTEHYALDWHAQELEKLGEAHVVLHHYLGRRAYLRAEVDGIWRRAIENASPIEAVRLRATKLREAIHRAATRISPAIVDILHRAGW